MSVQLKEPCIRSLIHGVRKFWPMSTFLHPPKNKLTFHHLQNYHQYKTIPVINYPFVLSHMNYSTTATIVQSTEDAIENHSLNSTSSKMENDLKCALKSKNKKNTATIWKLYETVQAEANLSVEEMEQLMLTMMGKGTLLAKKSLSWDRIIQVFDNCKSKGLQPSPDMYLSAMTAYGRLGDIEKVQTVFKEYKQCYKLGANVYSRHVDAVLDCNELMTAYRTFQDIRDNKFISTKESSVYLERIVCFCLKRDKPGLAMKAIDGMVESTNVSEWDKESLEKVTRELFTNYANRLHLEEKSITPTSVELFVSEYLKIPTKSSTNLTNMIKLLYNCNNIDFLPTVKAWNLVLQSTDDPKTILDMTQKLDIEPYPETVAMLLNKTEHGLSPEELKNLYEQLKIDKKTNTINPIVCNEFVKLFSQISSAKTRLAISDLTQNGYKADDSAILIMARGLIQRGQPDSGLRWLERCHSFEDLDSFAMIMEALLEKGEHRKCIGEYERLLHKNIAGVDLNRRIVKAMLTANFALGESWTGCEKLLLNLKIQFTSITLMRILNVLLNLKTKKGASQVPSKNILKSLQLMESNLNIQSSPENISRIITSFGKRGDIEDGFRLYNYVRNEADKRGADVSIYKALMFSAIENNDLRKLERAWVDMQYRERFNDKVNCQQRVPHSLKYYNILLNGYASRLPRPDITRAKRLFKRMMKENLCPDLVSYNTLIKAFVNANNMEAANRIFEEMRCSGINPDVWTTNTMLSGWVIRKEWNFVENFVQELKSAPTIYPDLDIVTFNLLVQSFLQLDSKSMTYEHVLKKQNKWSHVEHLKLGVQSLRVEMTSETIWNIFEATTGYSKNSISNSPATETPTTYKLLSKRHDKHISRNPRAFISLFSNATDADEATYKLFMKAFMNINDKKSASKVHDWMNYCLPL